MALLLLLPLLSLSAQQPMEPDGAGFAAGIVRPVAPPLGWRSWNFFQCNISQAVMQAQMDGIARPRKGGRSLLSLGYDHVGLDDCWQNCDAPHGFFHDKVTGQPQIDTTKFPSLGKMVEHGHALDVKVGFYQDNCRCHECERGHVGQQCWNKNTHYPQDANLTQSLMFDGVKIDSCGNQRDMTEWASEFAKPGNHPLLVESCGNGPKGTNPKKDQGIMPAWKAMLETTCPFSFYRVSVDLAPQWFSVVYNMNRALPYLGAKPLSRPGCWAYSDMLEVGIRLPNGVGLTHTESRVHFAMWAVTSSPLILGFDLTDDAVVDSVMDIVANEEVIAISQQWAGHPGRLVRNASASFDALTKHGCSDRRGDNQSMPEYQVWAKPQPNRSIALLVVNICDAEHCPDASKLSLDLTIPLSEIYVAPWEEEDTAVIAAVPQAVRVRDIWGHSEQGVANGSVRVKGVGGHDGAFLLLTPTATASTASTADSTVVPTSVAS